MIHFKNIFILIFILFILTSCFNSEKQQENIENAEVTLITSTGSNINDTENSINLEKIDNSNLEKKESYRSN